MAILITAKIHESPSVAEHANAYLHVDIVQEARLMGELNIQLACFASQDEREAFGQARADIVEWQAVVDKGEPQPLPLAPDAKAKQIDAVAADLSARSQAWIAARASLMKAQRRLAEIKPIQPLGKALDVRLPLAGCLIDGRVDVGLIYDWLMKNGYDGKKV